MPEHLKHDPFSATLQGPAKSLWTCCLKRIFDVLFAATGLVVLAPLFVAIAFMIKGTDPGPVFYRGARSGLNGRSFRIFKFRTMVDNAENLGGPSTALNDPRLTKIGRFLRKYKFDELPQLINILIGDMSFVGPRPQVEKYTKLYADKERVILSVRPGLTDYASIRFVNLDQLLGDSSVDERYLSEIEPEKNRLRVEYVESVSFSTDMKILALTALTIFRIPTIWNTDN